MAPACTHVRRHPPINSLGKHELGSARQPRLCVGLPPRLPGGGGGAPPFPPLPRALVPLDERVCTRVHTLRAWPGRPTKMSAVHANLKADPRPQHLAPGPARHAPTGRSQWSPSEGRHIVISILARHARHAGLPDWTCLYALPRHACDPGRRPPVAHGHVHLASLVPDVVAPPFGGPRKTTEERHAGPVIARRTPQAGAGLTAIHTV